MWRVPEVVRGLVPPVSTALWLLLLVASGMAEYAQLLRGHVAEWSNDVSIGTGRGQLVRGVVDHGDCEDDRCLEAKGVNWVCCGFIWKVTRGIVFDFLSGFPYKTMVSFDICF